ncbi:Phox homologous domain-containing protein [Phycomyces blakesleeanus]
MSQMIQAIFVPKVDNISKPKAHTVYCLDVHAAVRTWQVWRRYSEFVRLHEYFLEAFPHHSLPSPFPVKRYFPSTFSSPTKVDERRRALETYLRGILASQDARWRQTQAWRDFMGVPVGRQVNECPSERWLEEFEQLNNYTHQIRALVNRRATHLARNETSASHNCTVHAKRLLNTITTRMASLSHLLGGLSEGEQRRRQDLLNSLREEKDSLHHLVHAGRYTDTPTPQADETPEMVSVQAIPTKGRVFGPSSKKVILQDTPKTRVLDNEGLIGYQQQTMKDQDNNIEQFLSVLARQKQIAFAIGDELSLQNQLLDEIDQDADTTNLKFKMVTKKVMAIQ